MHKELVNLPDFLLNLPLRQRALSKSIEDGVLTNILHNYKQINFFISWNPLPLCYQCAEQVLSKSHSPNYFNLVANALTIETGSFCKALI